jgi:hypothetical protein
VAAPVGLRNTVAGSLRILGQLQRRTCNVVFHLRLCGGIVYLESYERKGDFHVGSNSAAVLGRHERPEQAKWGGSVVTIQFLIKNVTFRAAKHIPWSGHNRMIRRHEYVLHGYRCIFVHIPKTGGDSIHEALASLPRKTDVIAPRLPKHAKAFEVRDVLGDAVWKDYFSFAFVRNPWDQMVSSYHWWLQKAPVYAKLRDPDVCRVRRMQSFAEFLDSGYGRTMINEMPGNTFDWISQDGQIIVDFVGRFEHFGRDWLTVCDRLGISPPALPHVNSTRRQPYREYYTDETRAIVEQRFRKIIETFGYEF